MALNVIQNTFKNCQILLEILFERTYTIKKCSPSGIHQNFCTLAALHAKKHKNKLVFQNTVYKGKQLVALCSVNTVWANCYSAFPTYRVAAGVAQNRCSVTALSCCACFPLLFRRFVSIKGVSSFF